MYVKQTSVIKIPPLVKFKTNHITGTLTDHQVKYLWTTPIIFFDVVFSTEFHETDDCFTHSSHLLSVIRRPLLTPLYLLSTPKPLVPSSHRSSSSVVRAVPISDSERTSKKIKDYGSLNELCSTSFRSTTYFSLIFDGTLTKTVL